MSSSTSHTSEIEMKLLLPRVITPHKTSVVDLRNLSLVLIIWDILLGIPFSFVVVLVIKAIFRWVGYDNIILYGTGVFASRTVMVVVNLWIIWSWREQLIQGEREESVRAEIEMLDEVIASLENVLAGVEAKEIEEQLLDDMTKPEDLRDVILDPERTQKENNYSS